MTLNQPEFCSHSGDIVISSSGGSALCADCETPMMWVALRDLQAAHQTIVEHEETIRLLSAGLRSAKADYLAGLAALTEQYRQDLR